MAHFHYKLPNGMTLGYVDGRFPANLCLTGWNEHYSNCFDERAETGHVIPFDSEKTWEDRQIQFATVDTHYSTYYRIVDKQYFHHGSDFPLNWEDSDRKRDVAHRYSPIGTVGHYLGCTYDAAMDEMLYYGNGTVDTSKYILIVIECYFERILYLSDYGVLCTVCEKIGHPVANPLDVMMDVLNPHTTNDLTDRIGIWAREQGMRGIVYPTARFDQQQDIRRAIAEGQPLYPMINNVSLNSRMDLSFAWSSQLSHFTHSMTDKGFVDFDNWIPIYADLNLVLFSGEQLRGNDRAVFWQTSPLEHSEVLVAQDGRPTTESTAFWWDRNGENLHPKPKAWIK